MNKYVLVMLLVSFNLTAQDELEDLVDLEDLSSLGNISVDGVAETDQQNQTIKTNGVSVDLQNLEVNAQGITVNTQGVKVGNATQVNTTLSGRTYRDDDFINVDWANKNMAGNQFINVNFESANLSGTDFSFSSFLNADFMGVNLDGACFYGATFVNTDIDEESSLIDTNFSNTKMTNSDIYAEDRRAVFNGENCGSGKRIIQEEPVSRVELMNAQGIVQALSEGTNATVDLTINFETNSDRLLGKARAQVYEIAKALKSAELASQRFSIQGHTDSDGEDSYNEDLSYRRALAVSRELSQSYEVNDARLSVQGFGESQPIASNSTASGKALNRRVTLVNLGAN